MLAPEMMRNQRRRLWIIRHVEEVAHNVAKTCRYCGISRMAFYRWHRRYQEEGEEGLYDRSKSPHNCPRATKPEIVAKILYLRQTYHFGPWKIKMYLLRCHDVTICSSGIWRILKKLNMSRLPQYQRYKRHHERWKRYEKPKPGHCIQLDVKFLERIPGTRRRHCQYTAIDEFTRLRVLKIYYKCNQKTSIQFVDYVLSRFPFHADLIQTDNGGKFRDQFHWHVLDKGINHVYIKPYRPRLNGKVERSQRIDDEEFYWLLEGGVIDETGLFNEKLREWEDFYNYHRPHSALGGKTPYERFREKVGLSV